MPEVLNQPGQLATSSVPENEFRITGTLIIIGGRRFILVPPEPATPLPADIADARAARAALDDTEERKPYDQVRGDLGIK